MWAKPPMTARLMPSVLSHAGSRLIRMYSGRPEANPVKTQISMRRFSTLHHDVVSEAGGADGMRDCNLPPNPDPVLEPRVVVDRQRCVIGKTLRLIDAHSPRPCGDSRSRNLVVDAPAHVLRPRLAAIRPPGVLPRPRVHAAEHVHPADFVEGLRQPGALLGEESGVLAISAPVLEIDLLVRDVPVPAQDEFAAPRLEVPQHRHEFVEKAELGLLPLLRARSGGHVHRHDREPAEIRAKEYPLAIELPAAVAARDAVGLRSGIESDAAVALLGRAAVVVTVVSPRNEREVGEVCLLGLDLLHAPHIRALAREPPRETLGERRADAVEIERDNA